MSKFKKDEEDRGKRTVRIAMAIFVAFIMVASILGIMTYNNAPLDTEYNGFKFKQIMVDDTQYVWETKINGNKLYFNYHPSQVDGIEAEGIKELVIGSYGITFTNPSPDNSQFDLIAKIEEMIEDHLESLDKPYIHGFINSSGYSDVPEITCDNATQAAPVVYIDFANYTGIEVSNNCVKMIAVQPSDLVVLKDRFLYDLYDIIDENEAAAEE